MNPMHWDELSKAQKYEKIHTQWTGLMDPSVDAVANLANACALLKEAFGWWWIGFYRKINDSLVLGPFQGPVACTTIEDVESFPGHIACSAASKSEIVVPLWRKDGSFWGVLDVDSEHLAHFDTLDQIELEKFCRSLEIILS
jgi:GAF domain-containing protein